MYQLPKLLAKPLLSVAAIALLASVATAQQQQNSSQTAANQQRSAPLVGSQPAQYPNALPTEAKSKAACEAVADRLFVTHDQGSECIAYLTTAARTNTAVLYFEGDVPAADLLKPNFSQNYLTEVRSVFQRMATQHGVRFVFVSRPGVFGSSGNHGSRRSIGEMLTMNAAVDGLKSRLGFSNVIIAGQSGGSTIGAALLTLGRRDISCAVLGSGLLSVVDIEYAHRVRERLPEIKPAIMHVQLFDPTDRLDWIERQNTRRIFVVGDPTDTRTPFPQQRSFADRLRGLGHHARTIEVSALGELMHGVAHLTLPAAGMCARGIDDVAIRQAIAPNARPAARTVTSEVTQ